MIIDRNRLIGYRGNGNINTKTRSKDLLKYGTVLTIIAVIASAMAVLFVLDAEADNSSAQIAETGRCGQDAYYMYFTDGSLELFGTGSTYDYSYYLPPWYDYRKDITKIVVGEDITGLGAWTFVKCKNVKELTIPITLNSVGSDLSSAFAGCINIEKINFTYGTNGCGYNYSANRGSDSWYQNTPWYQSREALKEINFSERIQTIGSDAFRELNITALTIPDNITALGNHCFMNCEKLTDLTIPVSLNSYGNENYPAFEGCMAVEYVKITYGNGVPFDYMNWSGIYKSKLAPWNLNENIAKTIVISEDLEKLGRYMFWYTNIKDLTIPLSTTPYSAIYTNVFYFYGPYESLEKVTITKGTGFVYDYNKQGSSLYLPWNKAPNLKTLKIEEGVTDLGDYTFNACKAETVILPNSLESLGELTFINCSMKYLTLPISLNAAWLDKDSPFQGVTGVEKITFTPGSGCGFNYAAYKGSNCWYQLTPWYQSRKVLQDITFEDGIKRIGSDAFRELNIRTIEIPDSVETLGNHSFYNCNQIYSLTLPISLDCIYSAAYPAFDKCDNIINLRLTVGLNGAGYDYTDYTPFWCYYNHFIDKLTVDKGINYIGTNTFVGYTFFTSDDKRMSSTAEDLSGHLFTGSSGILRVSDRALDGPDYPTNSNSDTGVCGPNATYTYSDGTLTISGYGDMYNYSFAGTPWFSHTDEIQKIIIGDGITSLSKWAFIKCTSLKELTMPITLNSVVFDTYPAFQGCCNIEKVTFTCGDGGYGKDYAAYKGSNCWYQLTPWYQSRDTLTEITFANGTTHIGSDAFRELNITSIVIPDSVTSLGSHCFYNCGAMTDLKISMSVNPYGNENYPAFQGCTALETFTFSRGTGSPYSYDDWTGGAPNAKKTPWNMYPAVPKKVIILEDVASFGKCIFQGCNIKELTIPISLNAVWLDYYEVFKDITGIEKITLTPGSGYGFNYAVNTGTNCSFKHTPWYISRDSLKEIIFEDGIKSIGANAFRELNLTSIVIPDSVVSLGDNSFYQCNKLTDITIPITLDSISSTNNPAFDQCNNISSLRLTAGSNGVGFDYTDHLPIWCTSGCFLSKITVDRGITYIGTNTFAGYTFYTSESETISPIAENLSGHNFTGSSGVMKISDRGFDSTDPSGELNKHTATGAVTIGTAVVAAIIVTFAYMWVRNKP